MTATEWIGTFGGIGLLRPAPGTWGSAAAIPLAWGLHELGGPWLLGLAVVALYILGIWAVTRIIADSRDKDPSFVVVDEVVGQWIAFLPVSIGAAHVGADLISLWPGWVTAFLAFRLFDIWKPGPVGWADRRGQATGVMLDDLIAGAMAAVVVVALAALAHGVMML